ncbi:MAG: phage tail protein [Paraburkholderia fungorum]|nr:phage tail protein [Paraburkholderia fungorum]
MAAETFTWLVRVGDAGAIKFRSRGAQFGDGYKQLVGDGINGKSSSWPITIIEPMDAMQPITDFLDRHGGYVPFQWTPPYGAAALFTCAGYTPKRTAGSLITLTATFEQYFGVASNG